MYPYLTILRRNNQACTFKNSRYTKLTETLILCGFHGTFSSGFQGQKRSFSESFCRHFQAAFPHPFPGVFSVFPGSVLPHSRLVSDSIFSTVPVHFRLGCRICSGSVPFHLRSYFGTGFPHTPGTTCANTSPMLSRMIRSA